MRSLLSDAGWIDEKPFRSEEYDRKNIEKETLRSQMGAVGFARIKALRDIETFHVYLERPVSPWPIKRIYLHSFNAKEEGCRSDENWLGIMNHFELFFHLHNRYTSPKVRVLHHKQDK
jgi:hypothetical protein